jgi:cysteine synthase B
LPVGHSGGASLYCAVKIAERLQAEERKGTVVAIVADRGDRYFAPMKWERRYVW